jgi:uncharacterized protein YukE
MYGIKMNDSDLRCAGRSDCSSPVVIACNCGIPVVHLCEGCISSHVLKPGNHRLLHLNQAKLLISTSSFSGHIEESYISYLRIKSDILAYIQNLKDFKTKVSTFKFEIIDQIEKTFDSKLEKIDSILDRTYVQLHELNQESDNQALQRFEEKGLEGVLSDYIYNMNLNIDDIKEALNDIIVLETKDSYRIQGQSHASAVLPIQIQELQELIQAQTSRSDELENRLNQLQQGSIRELQDKTSVLESLIIEQEARSKTHEDSFKQLEDNMRGVYDTLEKLKSYPNTIVKQTNQTLQEVQQAFNEKYARIDQEIINIKSLTAQIQEIQQIQADTRAKQVIQPQPIQTSSNPRQEEVKIIPELEEVKVPQPKSTPRLNRQLSSRSTTFDLKYNKELIKYDSDTDTITTYNLNNLPYYLQYAATTMLPDGSIIIAGG